MGRRRSPTPSDPTRQSHARPLARLGHRLKEEKKEWGRQEVGGREETKGREGRVEDTRMVGSMGWPWSCKLSTPARLCPTSPRQSLGYSIQVEPRDWLGLEKPSGFSCLLHLMPHAPILGNAMAAIGPLCRPELSGCLPSPRGSPGVPAPNLFV